jgi:hypothetical protein
LRRDADGVGDESGGQHVCDDSCGSDSVVQRTPTFRSHLAAATNTTNGVATANLIEF